LNGSNRPVVNTLRTLALALACLALPVSIASAKVTTLSKCTFSALQTAVAHGGVIDFGCNGAIAFSIPITISSGSVTLDASGQSVAFDGQSKTQLFLVKGGTVTLIDLTLLDGKVKARRAPRARRGPREPPVMPARRAPTGPTASTPVTLARPATTAARRATAIRARRASTASAVPMATAARSTSLPAAG